MQRWVCCCSGGPWQAEVNLKASLWRQTKGSAKSCSWGGITPSTNTTPGSARVEGRAAGNNCEKMSQGTPSWTQGSNVILQQSPTSPWASWGGGAPAGQEKWSFLSTQPAPGVMGMLEWASKVPTDDWGAGVLSCEGRLRELGLLSMEKGKLWDLTNA